MRKIIISCDGTWNGPDQASKKFNVRKPTNIVKITRALKPLSDDGSSQICYYDSGVGTGNLFDKYVGGSTGKGLEKNIMEAYRFLVNNYNPGDEVFFYGFSRGAYTVRSLSGLINSIGLLPKNQDYWFPEGYRLYQKRAVISDRKKFIKQNNCKEMPIKMIGVFDTIGALGVPVGFLNKISKKKHSFHNVNVSPNVLHAYHALAIDEHRKAFKPAIWKNKKSEQTLEQVWFPGVHTNIGGGYDDDGLANSALNWIVEKSEGLGLSFDHKYLKYFKSFPDDTLYESKKDMYRFAGDYPRPICSYINGNESINKSVYERWNSKNKKIKYKPDNLAAYFNERNIDPANPPS